MDSEVYQTHAFSKTQHTFAILSDINYVVHINLFEALTLCIPINNFLTSVCKGETLIFTEEVRVGSHAVSRAICGTGFSPSTSGFPRQ